MNCEPAFFLQFLTFPSRHYLFHFHALPVFLYRTIPTRWKMKSKLKAKGIAIVLESALDKAYANLQLGEPSKKISKIMSRATKGIALEIKSHLKEEARREKKRKNEEKLKARKAEKKLKKKVARLQQMSA
jgi:hypothetical protein